MLQNKNEAAFTLVELIVAASLLIILSTIGFYSYTQSLWSARDSARKSDLITLEAQLLNHKRVFGSFPVPGNSFEIHNRWYRVANQWLLNREVWIENATTLPVDPLIDRAYTYSTTRNRQEFQLAATLENEDINKSIIRWNYVSVSRNILPTIILAYDGSGIIEINQSVWDWNTNRNSFVFDESIINLVYDIETWSPLTRWDFSWLMDEAMNNNFWQSTSYRSCEEISNAWKRISPEWWNDEYQIRNSSWELEDISCTCDTNWCQEQT